MWTGHVVKASGGGAEGGVRDGAVVAHRVGKCGVRAGRWAARGSSGRCGSMEARQCKVPHAPPEGPLHGLAKAGNGLGSWARVAYSFLHAPCPSHGPTPFPPLRTFTATRALHPAPCTSPMQNKQSEFAAPLTSFDWNEADPKRLGTSSIDTTCTIWDIEVGKGRGAAEGPAARGPPASR